MEREQLEAALSKIVDDSDVGDAAKSSLIALRAATTVSIVNDSSNLVSRNSLIDTYELRQRTLDKKGAQVEGLDGTLRALKKLDCVGVDVIVAQLHPGYLTLFADPTGAIVGVLNLSWVRRDREHSSSEE